MATYYGWPHCTYPGCGHQNLYKTRDKVLKTMMTHPDWVDGKGALCSCHAPLDTYPCTWATFLATFQNGDS